MILGTKPGAFIVCANRLALCLSKILGNVSSLEGDIDFKQRKKIAELIAKYELMQRPEGGWHCQTFRANDWVKAEGDALTNQEGLARQLFTCFHKMIYQPSILFNQMKPGIFIQGMLYCSELLSLLVVNSMKSRERGSAIYC